MANTREPESCEACGRQLPTHQGRGRKRRYCDAKCRDAARRQRGRLERHKQGDVKNSLTSGPGHDFLDDIKFTASTDDPVAARVSAATHRLVAEFGPAGSPRDAVTAARELSAAADEALQVAIDRARAAGRSWKEIGDVLGTSKQAAFQRFGHPVDPRTGAPMSRTVPPEARERANAFLASFTEGRWADVLDDFDDHMRERHDVSRLASGWAMMIGLYGAYQSMGEVSPVLAGDDVVIDVPVYFEAGEAMLGARFDRNGKVAGLRLHPPSR
jgi:Protein of unknown function (DUF3887)